jgi:hypothetical protein
MLVARTSSLPNASLANTSASLELPADPETLSVDRISAPVSNRTVHMSVANSSGVARERKRRVQLQPTAGGGEVHASNFHNLAFGMSDDEYPNATGPLTSRAYVSWAPLLDTFPRESGGSFFRISWTDVNYSATTEFYTVWFRDIDARDAQQLQCLTSNEDASSVGPLVSWEDRCGNITNANSAGSACHPFWAVEQTATGSASSETFTISPFSLWAAQSNLTIDDWAGLRNLCAYDYRSHKIHLFVLACHGNPASPTCDVDKPSRSLLVEISCEGHVQRLLLEDDTVELSASSCIRCRTLDPFGEFCEDAKSEQPQLWSSWDCIKDDFDEGCARFTEPMGSLTLSMCDHANRYNVRTLACLDSKCEATAAMDDVFEYEFKHPSGVRATECFGQPSAAAVTAGTAAVVAVGGTIAGTVGGSVASAITSSTTAAGSGLLPMIGAVQFAAATSDMCGVQSQPELLDILSVMQSLNVFNLRIPIPDLSGTALGFINSLPILLCGVTEDTSLEGQARSEVGSIFTTNVLVALVGLVVVVKLHLLVLALTPGRWRLTVVHAFPFLQLELSLYLTANQGLLISAAQLMGMAGDNGVCFFSGLVVLMAPTGFLLFVCFLLFRYVRPSSEAAKVRWNAEEGEWVLAKGSEKGEDSVSGHRSIRPRNKARGKIARKVRDLVRGPVATTTVAPDFDAVLPGDSEDAMPGDEHGLIVVDGRRPLAILRAVHQAAARSLASVKPDFHIRVDPLLRGWHSKRLAWIGPALLLGVEYGLGLAMGFGAMASCASEQVKCESLSYSVSPAPTLTLPAYPRRLIAGGKHRNVHLFGALSASVSAIRR